MIIFQSFFLSFSTFWRYLIVMPFVVGIAFVLILGFMFIFPLVAILIYLVASTFSALIAIRGALAAKGVFGEPVLSRLLTASLGYGLLQTFFYLLMYFAAILVVMIIGIYELEDVNQALMSGDTDNLKQLFYSHPMMMSVAIGTLLAVNAFSCALLVPMSASAYSASRKAKPLDFFWGFGASFISLSIVLIFVNLIAFGTDVYTKSVEFISYGIMYAMTKLTGARGLFTPVEADEIIIMAFCFLASVWLFCWQYAAGALAFLKRREKIEQRKVAESSGPVEHPVDLAELRKSRL